jgi:hypothetical protein
MTLENYDSVWQLDHIKPLNGKNEPFDLNTLEGCLVSASLEQLAADLFLQEREQRQSRELPNMPDLRERVYYK